MNGTSVTGWEALPNPGPSWHAIGTGDFNGDGHSDILWQNSDGSPSIWLMNGGSVIGWEALPNPGPTWHVIGSGDFNADGKADILWQNNDGSPSIWEMNGGSVIGWGALPNPGPTWHVIGSSDVNGDGKADILWQNDDGSPSVWFMNGTSIAGFAPLANPGSTWQLKDDGPIQSDQTVSNGGTTQAGPLTGMAYRSAPDVALGGGVAAALASNDGSSTGNPPSLNAAGDPAATPHPGYPNPLAAGIMNLSAPDTLVGSLNSAQGLTGLTQKTLANS
jgi:hypothetical protein